MYCTIEFEKQRECAVVPLIWLLNEQKGCMWPPNIRKDDQFSEYVINKRKPTSSWKQYDVKKVHFVSAIYEEACAFLNKLIEDSGSDTGNSKEHQLVRKEVSPDLKQPELETSGKMKHILGSQSLELEMPISKKQKLNVSDDEFSSEDTLDPPTPEATITSSFDTTLTYASRSSTSLQTPSSRTSTPPITPQLDANLVEVLLRRVEKVIATQDQQSITLDNILRNQQLQSHHLVERPVGFPKLPIGNKAEYRAVEDFLANDEHFSYMKQRLSTIGGSTVRNTTMNIMKFLLTNQIGMKFNWSGKDKRPFKKTKMCSVIFEAITLAYGSNENRADVNDKVIRESIQDWLKLSKARFTYSVQRKEK